MRAGLATAVAILLLPAVQGQEVAAPAHQPLAAPDWSLHVQREELGGKGDLAGAVRVLRFVQVSDAHILDDDAPYPLRQEQLDRLDPSFGAAQRPQEEFTDEVLDSMLQAINRLHGQDPLQFVLNTGDNIDNDLENELMRFLDVYDGTLTTVGPLSGLACRPDGQSASTQDASQDVTDACTSLPPALAAGHGGLAEGLPWYSAFGNHDALIQGRVTVEPTFQDVARQVGRRFLQQAEYVAMHFPDAAPCPGAPGGSPADDFGHGFGLAGARLCDGDPDNDGYYAFSVGAVRFVVLDTVNDDFVAGNGHLQGAFNPQTMVGADVIGGLAEGSVDPAQAAWLDAEVAANPDKLVVVASHHTVNSMFSNLAEAYCEPAVGCLDQLLEEAGYKTGPQLVEELAQHPNVVAWIGGHTHRHRVQPKGTGGFCQAVAQPDCDPERGFWNIESSSLVDFPQQARAVELWATADGAKAFWRLISLDHSFEPSRDLEATDPQREPAGLGDPDDRDVLLWFDVPAGVRLAPLPEAPRQWRFRVLEPTGEVLAGRPVDVAIAIDDALHPEGPLPAGLSVGWSGFGPHPPAGPPDPSLPRAGVGLESTQNSSAVLARGSFTPESAGTYYAIVELGWERGLLGEQAIGITVVEPPAEPKRSPGLPLALGLAGLAGALAARRR